MTVKTNNRSHRAIFMVALLVFAVALTTALVLVAGERKTEGSKTSTPQSNTVPSRSALWLSGKTHV